MHTPDTATQIQTPDVNGAIKNLMGDSLIVYLIPCILLYIKYDVDVIGIVQW